MFQSFRTSVPAIGLDVGAESLKLLQLAATPTGLAVRAALRVPIPEGVKGDPDKRVVFAGETVRAALRGKQFLGRRIVAALPKELVHYKTHRLPPMSADELPMAARIDARDLFRFDPDSADVQCIDAGAVRQGTERKREVILIAAGKQYINDFVLSLHRAGGIVSALDIDPCAIWRATDTDALATEAPARVVLDIGAAQSRLVIGVGPDIHLIKTIDVGGDQLRTTIVRKLGLPVPEIEQLRRRALSDTTDKLDSIRRVLHDAMRHAIEMLAREVQSSVRYHAVTFRAPAPARIELVGGEAGDPQIRATISELLNLPVDPIDVFAGIDTTSMIESERTASRGEWAVVLGLALRGLPAGWPSRTLSVAASSPMILEAGRSELSVGPAVATPAGGSHD